VNADRYEPCAGGRLRKFPRDLRVALAAYEAKRVTACWWCGETATRRVSHHDHRDQQRGACRAHVSALAQWSREALAARQREC
jgi:hypothetical protein